MPEKPNLAKIIYDAYPDTDLLLIDPDNDLKDFKTLHRLVTEGDDAGVGDGLFDFIVREIHSTGDDGTGNINLQAAIAAMERVVDDLIRVVNALKKEIG